MDWAGGALMFVVAGVLLALLVEFGVAPRIVARDNLRLWHGVGSGMYVLQWLCAGVVLWKTSSLVIPDLIRDPWIAGRARNDGFSSSGPS